MEEILTASDGMIAAERRRKICEIVNERGMVTVTDLSEVFGIGANTIRHDLNILHNQKRLQRSHGGAVTCENKPATIYSGSDVHCAHMIEKAQIAETALQYMPDSGSVFIGSGSTTYQLAVRIRKDLPINVITVSPEIAIHVSANTNITVDLLGGRIRPADSYATDCSLAEDALNRLHWETAFMGATGIDVEGGITSIDRIAAVYERKQMERASKVVVLCDSSKLGSYSYAQIGPVTLINVLITDSGARPDIIDGLRDKGIEVVIAG